MIAGVRRYEARRRWTIEGLVWTGENIEAMQDFVGLHTVFLSAALSPEGMPQYVISTPYGSGFLEPGMVVLRSVTGRVSFYSALQFADGYVPEGEA